MFNKEEKPKVSPELPSSPKKKELLKSASEIFIEVPKTDLKKKEDKALVSDAEIQSFVKSAKALSEEDIKNGEVVVLKDCPACCVDKICANFRGCHHKPAMVNGDLVYPA